LGMDYADSDLMICLSLVAVDGAQLIWKGESLPPSQLIRGQP
jgi:hypothetical protein